MNDEDQNAITSQHNAILPLVSEEVMEDTDKEHRALPASLQTQKTHVKTRSSKRRTPKLLFLLPTFAYIMAALIGNHAMFLFLTTTSLEEIFLQFVVATIFGMVGNFMFVVLLFLVA